MPIFEGSVEEFAVLAEALEQFLVQLEEGLRLLDRPALQSTRVHLDTRIRVAAAILERLRKAGQ